MNIDVTKYREYLEKNNIKKYNNKAIIDKLTDEFLQEIINNTKKFIIMILNKMKKELNTYKDSIFTNVIIYEDIIHLKNKSNDDYIDDLYCPIEFDEDTWISRYILKQYLNNINIDLYYDEYTIKEYNGINSIYSLPNIKISCPIETFKKLYKNINRKKGA